MSPEAAQSIERIRKQCELKVQIILLSDQGKSLREVGEALNVKFGVVAYWRRMSLIPPGARGRPHGYMNRETRARVEKVFALRLTGLTYQKIGDELGITRQRVEQILREYRERWLQWQSETSPAPISPGQPPSP